MVVDEIGIEDILRGRLSDDLTDADSAADEASQWTNFGLLDLLRKVKGAVSPSIPESEKSQATRILLETTSFSSPKESNVIEIRCGAENARFAQRIVDSWTNAFLLEHQRLTRTAGSFEFFTQQVSKIQGELADAEKALKDAKVECRLASVEGQQTILENRIDGIRAKMLLNDAALASAEAKLKKLENIARMQDSILTEETLVASLRAENEVLAEQYQQLVEELRQLHANALRIANLEREIEVLETKYRTHVEKLEEARIQHSLDDQRISSVNVLQQATLAETPVGPGKLAKLLLAILAAAFASATLVLLIEYLDRSFRTAVDVERTLQLPVLATIPKVDQPLKLTFPPRDGETTNPDSGQPKVSTAKPEMVAS
jgi:uncharacterized protein involved in exopolysaccharide biosynthesis